jgi:hypothetical protein
VQPIPTQEEQQMVRLDRRSLDFAKMHVTRFYDSDFFPKAFEFRALFARWDEVVDFVSARDVVELPAPRPCQSSRFILKR